MRILKIYKFNELPIKAQQNAYKEYQLLGCSWDEDYAGRYIEDILQQDYNFSKNGNIIRGISVNDF